MKVIIEVFFTKLIAENLFYKNQKIDLIANPEETVKKLAIQELGKSKFLYHSTSWRSTNPKTVVLTYFVYSDDLSLKDSQKMSLNDVDFKNGRFKKLTKDKEKNVFAHTIRHLSFLVRTNPDWARQTMRQSTQNKLEKLSGELAGQIN
jgi:hypothetical protein